MKPQHRPLSIDVPLVCKLRYKVAILIDVNKLVVDRFGNRGESGRESGSQQAGRGYIGRE